MSSFRSSSHRLLRHGLGSVIRSSLSLISGLFLDKFERPARVPRAIVPSHSPRSRFPGYRTRPSHGELSERDRRSRSSFSSTTQPDFLPDPVARIGIPINPRLIPEERGREGRRPRRTPYSRSPLLPSTTPPSRAVREFGRTLRARKSSAVCPIDSPDIHTRRLLDASKPEVDGRRLPPPLPLFSWLRSRSARSRREDRRPAIVCAEPFRSF